MVGETTEVASLPGSHFTDPKLLLFFVIFPDIFGLHVYEDDIYIYSVMTVYLDLLI